MKLELISQNYRSLPKIFLWDCPHDVRSRGFFPQGGLARGSAPRWTGLAHLHMGDDHNEGDYDGQSQFHLWISWGVHDKGLWHLMLRLGIVKWFACGKETVSWYLVSTYWICGDEGIVKTESEGGRNCFYSYFLTHTHVRIIILLDTLSICSKVAKTVHSFHATTVHICWSK